MKCCALRLAALDEILPRELDAGFDRLRSAADEIGVGEPARLVADQRLGHALRPARTRRKRGVGIGERRGLLRHRRDHARMLVAEAGDRCAAGRVDHAASVLGEEKTPSPLIALGGVSRERAVQHAAGEAAMGQPFSET